MFFFETVSICSNGFTSLLCKSVNCRTDQWESSAQPVSRQITNYFTLFFPPFFVAGNAKQSHCTDKLRMVNTQVERRREHEKGEILLPIQYFNSSDES